MNQGLVLSEYNSGTTLQRCCENNNLCLPAGGKSRYVTLKVWSCNKKVIVIPQRSLGLNAAGSWRIYAGDLLLQKYGKHNKLDKCFMVKSRKHWRSEKELKNMSTIQTTDFRKEFRSSVITVACRSQVVKQLLDHERIFS